MFKKFLTLGVGFFVFSFSSFSNIGTVTAEDACYISNEKMSEMLAYPFNKYETYNDKGEIGWRGLSGKGCFAEAADYIHRYLKLHRAELEKPDLLIQTFHEAMMLSYSGEDDEALELFPSLLFPTSELGETWLLNGMDWNANDWNAYVSGTIAFFEKDRGALDEAIAFLSSRQKELKHDNANGSYSRIFITILSRLSNRWQSSYKDAYTKR